jgi:hypothetical protein
VLIEEVENRFKCWILEPADSKHREMSATIKGDV